MAISMRLWKGFFVGAEVSQSSAGKGFRAAQHESAIVARL